VAGAERRGPTILFTSLQGAKGLSACHVFIVGFVNGHFPQDPNAISDNEVCSLLGALSRTRKRCHVISVGHALGDWQRPSYFLQWMSPHLEAVTADKAYLESHGY
jgi:superfamily I DNA/RNA helicase